MESIRPGFCKHGEIRLRHLFLLLLAALMVMLLSCAHKEKVLIPPKVDLKTYPSIGVVEFSTSVKSLNAKAYIEAALKTRILETSSGATCWTRASSGTTQVAGINLTEGGPFSVGVSDPKDKYGELVPKLVYANTMDFRARYEYRTVK